MLRQPKLRPNAKEAQASNYRQLRWSAIRFMIFTELSSMSALRQTVVTITHTARTCRTIAGISATIHTSAASQANQALSTKKPTCFSTKRDTYQLPNYLNWRSKSYRKNMNLKRAKWVRAASRAVRVNQRRKKFKNSLTLSWQWHRKCSSKNSLLRKRFKLTVSQQARISQRRQMAQPQRLHPKGWRLLIRK